jgi:hypothetical protein
VEAAVGLTDADRIEAGRLLADDDRGARNRSAGRIPHDPGEASLRCAIALR